MTWIDVLAIATLAVAFYAGWRAGLVAEFFDLAALVSAALLATMWSGGFASGLPPTWPLSEASRHVIALWALFLLIYGVIRTLGWLFEHYFDWPGKHWIGRVGGGLIGAIKALLVLFAILYVALFFPIDRQVRDTLRASPIARQFDRYFPRINDAIVNLMPRYDKLIARPLMNAHRL
jgi:uncharacterized membrane protein required for colicin V production